MTSQVKSMADLTRQACVRLKLGLCMKNLEKRLGERIARQRKLVGLTQAKLAERVDIQPESLNRIERGKRGLSVQLLALLAESLDLEIHELIRLSPSNSAKDQAVERLFWFASRLSAEEVEIVMDVGAAALLHAHKDLQR